MRFSETEKDPEDYLSPAVIFGENVRVIRIFRRQSQVAVALAMVELGNETWKQSTVSLVEKGQRAVSVDEIWSLALALNTTVQYLMRPHEQDTPGLDWKGLQLGDALIEPYEADAFLTNPEDPSRPRGWYASWDDFTQALEWDALAKRKFDGIRETRPRK